MNPKDFQAALARDGYTDIESKFADANVTSQPHSHPRDIRALLTSGELTLSRGGASRVYRAGDTLELAAGEEHTEHSGPEGYNYIVGRR